MPKQMTFEESILRLEEIVALLESGKPTIEESIALFEEGTKLSKNCAAIVKNAESKIISLAECDADENPV